MTPEQATVKFGFTWRDCNFDRARDFVCLRCGNRESFRVGVVGLVTLTRTGDIGDYEHFELDPEQACKCQQCGADETIQDFLVPGLDDHLTDQQR